MARYYAIRKDPATREKLLRLNRLYAQVIGDPYYVVVRLEIEAEGRPPRFGIGLRVVDRQLEIHMAEVAAPKAFGHV